MQAGIKDIREAVEAGAAAARPGISVRRVLFLDEVHRFNKAQQDAFLPHVEDGTLTFIGATTENPSFEIDRRAALARARLRAASALVSEELRALLRRALSDEERGLGAQHLTVEDAGAGAAGTRRRW